MPTVLVFLLPLWALYCTACCIVATVDREGTAPLWLRWPAVAWDVIKRPINRAVYGPPPKPKADPLKIAVLEYELLGIEPKPGTTAAAAIRLSESARRVNEH